ncbi:MAG: hypothetical protein ACFFER_06235 [Candidatus Thorarchaeota archaeon]
MLEVLMFAVFIVIVLLGAACSYGRAPQSAKVKVTRPAPRKVDGFGGARAYDYSYSPPLSPSKPPFPVGLRHEREKTETYKTYSEREEKEKPEKQ